MLNKFGGFLIVAIPVTLCIAFIFMTWFFAFKDIGKPTCITTSSYTEEVAADGSTIVIEKKKHTTCKEIVKGE